MKVFITLLALFSITAAEVTLQNGGRYSPEEKYMYIADDNGVLHFENLDQDPANVEVNPSDLRLYLYTRRNTNPEVFSLDNLDDLLNSQYYNASNKNVFTVHGWRGTYTSAVNSRARQAIFNNGEDINAFAVDWHIPSNQFYTFAFWSIPLVGEIIGEYINKIIVEFNLDASDFYIIGHSLGAHVAGCIGASVSGTVQQIIGLDPAYPLFTLEERDNRLDETDAGTVHVAHTNAGFQGFRNSIGHADYYFNGGSKQPGCGPDIFNSCAHGRALDYYVESIETSGFRSLQCSTNEDFQSGACNNNREVYFGQFPIDETIFGDFYVDTAEASPFALG